MDTTIWKEVPTWEGLYEASNTGLIRSSRKTVEKTEHVEIYVCSKILRPAFDEHCYLKIHLARPGINEHWLMHQLIALTFELPNPDNKPILDHINGVRWDNRIENLRWVTQSENIKSSYDFGRKVKEGFSISQYDLEGNFIKSFRVIRDVEKDGFNSKCVNRVVLGQRKTAYGFLWKRNSGKAIQIR